jgi:hypothetical protein
MGCEVGITGTLAIGLGPPRSRMARRGPSATGPDGAGSEEHGKQGTGARSSPEAAARGWIHNVNQQ